MEPRRQNASKCIELMDTAKVLDFASGKVTYTGKTANESKCFDMYLSN